MASGAGRREDGRTARGVPSAAAAAGGAVGENGCHCASRTWRPATTRSSANGTAGLAHQSPNRTFVKYQRLEVSQSVVSTAASVPPSTGSTQGG